MAPQSSASIATSVAALTSQIGVVLWNNNKGLVTGPVVQSILTAIDSIAAVQNASAWNQVDNPFATTQQAQAGLAANVFLSPASLAAYSGQFQSVDPNSGRLWFLGPDLTTQSASGNQPGAVNFIAQQGGLTGFGPGMYALGSDTNIDLNYASKGTGSHIFGNGSGNLLQLLDPAGYGANWPTLAASISGNPITMGVAGADANVSWQILTNGNGGILLGSLTNTQRGVNSLAGGRFTTANGFASFAYGSGNVINGDFSVGLGNGSGDNLATGKLVFASSPFSNVAASCQIGWQVLQAISTGTSPVIPTSNGSALGATNSAPLKNNSVQSIDFIISAFDTVTLDSARWTIKSQFKRGASAATTSPVFGGGLATADFTSAGASAWTATLSADTTNGCVKLTLVGAGSNPIRWTVKTQTTEGSL